MACYSRIQFGALLKVLFCIFFSPHHTPFFIGIIARTEDEIPGKSIAIKDAIKIKTTIVTRNQASDLNSDIIQVTSSNCFGFLITHTHSCKFTALHGVESTPQGQSTVCD